MKIIPAIDILDNKLVRLEKGDYNSSKIYSEDPVEAAKRFYNAGFNLLHIVDLSGSKTGKISVTETIKRIKNETKLKIQFGGGIRSVADAKKLIDSGIDKLIIGSISVSDKNEFEKIILNVGSQKIIAAVDVKHDFVMIKGWTLDSNIKINDHINYCLSFGLETFLCTDIKKDGMLTGPNINLYKKLHKDFSSIKIIASGGVSNFKDLQKLSELDLYGAVVGKAIYENKIDLKELKKIAG